MALAPPLAAMASSCAYILCFEAQFGCSFQQDGTGGAHIQAAPFAAVAAGASGYDGAVSDLSCRSRVPAVETAIDIVALADLFTQHDDAEVPGLAGLAEKLLPGGHRMRVIVKVGRNLCDPLDNLRDGDIVPAERVRLQAYSLGMIHVAGERNSNAKHLVAGDFYGPDKLVDTLLDGCRHCAGLCGIPHTMLGQRISVKVSQNHHRRVLSKAHTYEVSVLSI